MPEPMTREELDKIRWNSENFEYKQDFATPEVDVERLLDEIERLRGLLDRFEGQRDPAERHADYTELRVKLYEATGVSPDTPMSYFGLVDLLIRQRDAARELTKILGAKRV